MGKPDVYRHGSSPIIAEFLLDMNLPKPSGENILKRLRSTRHYAQDPAILQPGSVVRNLLEKNARGAA
jgi:hypothetical protein